MKHEPGLTALLEVKNAKGDTTAVTTDTSWRCNSKTRLRLKIDKDWILWGNVIESVDATVEKGDWIKPWFDDSAWDRAVKVDGAKWGRFYPRTIPLLRETEITGGSIVQIIQNGKTDNTVRPLSNALPVEIKAPAEMVISIGQVAQAYWILDFDADQASEFEALPCQVFDPEFEIDSTALSGFITSKESKKTRRDYNRFNWHVVNDYKARAGRQEYMCMSTYGCKYLYLKLKSGRIRLHGEKFVDRGYPFVRLGQFKSNDSMLNTLWEKGVRTVELCSNDSYVDCALREQTEWMPNAAAVAYPITRIALAGPGENGGYLYSDPRLVRNMIRHTALSQQPDGRIKSHHPSDRYDIHWFIECQVSLWTGALRQYYESTGDADFVREIWPALVKQTKWLLDRRTKNGLVEAREFIFIDNPICYMYCEGATLNASVYKGLRDSVYLATVIGDKQKADEYTAAADALYRDFNRHLWNERLKTYYAAAGLEGNKFPPSTKHIYAYYLTDKKKAYIANLQEGGCFPVSGHAAMISLNRGIVPEDRRDSVRQWLIARCKEGTSGINYPYTHFWLFEEMYKMNSLEIDTYVLQIMRDRWKNMVERKDPGTLSEGFPGGALVHNMGGVPSYFLSCYVLGVSMDGPVWEKRIIIEPRLGDLKTAEGVVVTEHGLVPVSWKEANDGSLDFSFEIPAGVKASVSIPKVSDKPSLVINGKVVTDAQIRDRFITLEAAGGKYSGKITP